MKALDREPMWRTEYKLPMPAPQVAVQINLSPSPPIPRCEAEGCNMGGIRRMKDGVLLCPDCANARRDREEREAKLRARAR